MATLKDSNHFIQNSNLLRISGETNVQEDYKQLHQAGQGGFLLVEDGEVRKFFEAGAIYDRSKPPLPVLVRW